MELWEKETRKYQKRLKGFEQWRPDISHLFKRLPDIPLDYAPSNQGSVGIKLSLYVLGCLGFADQATAAFLKLWGSGLFTTISLPARLVYELWGATHFATKSIISQHRLLRHNGHSQ